MRKLLNLCCVCLLAVGVATGQDEHFTRYDFAPTFFNPANTGNFYGTYRVGVLYRDQFRTFYDGGSNYSTPTLFADANFNLAFRDQDWTSFGLTLISDKAGDVGLGSLGYMGNAAYHLSLDKKRRNVLTLGVQYGSVSIRVTDPTEANFETTLTGIGTENIDLNDVSAGYSDLNAGLTLVSKVGKTSVFEVGFAMGHLLKGEYQFSRAMSAVGGGNTNNEVNARINAHTKFKFLASEGLALEPVIYFSSMDKITNIQAQLNSTILINAEKEMALTAGLGYRVGDAGLILLGMNYGLWKVGLAYDMTLSSAKDATNSFGGFELGITRIIYRYKKPKINPVLLCPHL